MSFHLQGTWTLLFYPFSPFPLSPFAANSLHFLQHSFFFRLYHSSESNHLFWICTLLMFSTHSSTFIHLPYFLHSVLKSVTTLHWVWIFPGFLLWPILSPITFNCSLTSHSIDYTDCFTSFPTELSGQQHIILQLLFGGILTSFLGWLISGLPHDPSLNF